MPKVFSFAWSRARTSDFEQLLRPHVNYLYRLAYRFTGSDADAEDLLQDTLIKLLPRTKEMRALDQIRPWLARVLYRQFVDFARRRSRMPTDPSTAQDHESFEEWPDNKGGPLVLVERDLQIRQVIQALDRLGPDQRVVIAMHDIEGYSLEELGQILETPVGTLKSRLHRARNRLRAMLEVEPFSRAERVRG